MKKVDFESRGKIKNRITIALDDETSGLLNDLKTYSKDSQSCLIRKSIQFYHKFKKILENYNGNSEYCLKTYLDLLSHGEHIILDIDHYLSFLKFIEQSPNRNEFWEVNRLIGKAHAEEFCQTLDISTVENVIERLEACNFFKIVKENSNRYTLLLGSDIQKNFLKIFLEEVLNGMGFKVQIQEAFSKITIIK